MNASFEHLSNRTLIGCSQKSLRLSCVSVYGWLLEVIFIRLCTYVASGGFMALLMFKALVLIRYPFCIQISMLAKFSASFTYIKRCFWSLCGVRSVLCVCVCLSVDGLTGGW